MSTSGLKSSSGRAAEICIRMRRGPGNVSRKFVRRSPVIDHYLALSDRLTAAAQYGLALLCEWLAFTTVPARFLDWLDDRLARHRRHDFGRRSWLLSWSREPEGTWRARLSGPDLERTIERSARTRSWAIFRSARALARIRTFQSRDPKRRGRGTDSQP